MATKVDKRQERQKKRNEEMGITPEPVKKSRQEIIESRKMKNWSSDRWKWFLFFISIFCLWFMLRFGTTQ